MEKLDKWFDNVDQISVHHFTALSVFEMIFKCKKWIPISIFCVGHFEQKSAKDGQPSSLTLKKTCRTFLVVVDQRFEDVTFGLFVSIFEVAVGGAHQWSAFVWTFLKNRKQQIQIILLIFVLCYMLIMDKGTDISKGPA
jgi:hypothetical protein